MISGALWQVVPPDPQESNGGSALQLRSTVLGSIVDDIEPDDMKAVQVPVPEDKLMLKGIGLRVIEAIDAQKMAYECTEKLRGLLEGALRPASSACLRAPSQSANSGTEPGGRSHG
jgi:hypothetical protein